MWKEHKTMTVEILKAIIIDFLNNWLVKKLDIDIDQEIRSFNLFLKHYDLDDPDFQYYYSKIQRELETPIGTIYVLEPQHDTMKHWFAYPTPYGLLIFAF